MFLQQRGLLLHLFLKDEEDMGAATVIHNGGLAAQRPDLLPPPQASSRSNDERLADMEERVRSASVHDEFLSIPGKRPTAGTSTAQRPDCAGRNRYSNILPYEDTRVMLSPTKHNPLGYINASNIQVPLGENLLRYIATQGPLKETAGEFWQMVWESGAYILVMLTQTQEKGAERSAQYWPESGKSGKVRFGDFSIALVGSQSRSSSQVTSRLVLKHMPSGLKRQVYHLQFLPWPVAGVPHSVDTFLRFVDEVANLKRLVGNELAAESAALSPQPRSRSSSKGPAHINADLPPQRRSPSSGPKGSLNSSSHSGTSSSSGSWSRRILGARNHAPHPPLGLGHQHEDPPLVVHCCSGAGRTGVFILIDLMIYCLEHNHDMSVCRALALVRQQRMGLVGSPEQYHFVYDALIAYLANSRLI